LALMPWRPVLKGSPGMLDYKTATGLSTEIIKLRQIVAFCGRLSFAPLEDPWAVIGGMRQRRQPTPQRH
jgi:hypothetical protein